MINARHCLKKKINFYKMTKYLAGAARETAVPGVHKKAPKVKDHM